jgi:acyl carrier protein
MAGFRRILEEVMDLEGGTLRGDEELANLELWDSVARIGFIATADEVYGATIPPKRIAECRTVEDLAGLVREFAR